MTDATLARRIAQFCHDAANLVAADEAVDATLRSLVDALACITGAAQATPVRIAREVALETQAVSPGGVRAASVVGSDRQVTVEAAAFVNGVAIRYLDFNDIYLSREAVHPSDAIGVALAVAEAFECDGPQLLAAIATAYEVHCRLADAIRTRSRGFDHVVLNSIASTVVAGMLLRLPIDALAEAIAIAATANLATMQTRAGALSMWKAAAAAQAGRAGLQAALLARAGMTGPARALEGSYGWLAHLDTDGAEFDATSPTLRLMRTHLKPYPIGYFTQPAVDAAMQLRRVATLDAIVGIDVETSAFGRLANADDPAKWRPASRETADHSMPYGVAVALLDGAVGERQFHPTRIVAADVVHLMELITVRENESFTAAYPDKVSTRVTITQSDGGHHCVQVDHPLGHAANPMTARDIDAKFASLAPRIDPAQRAAWWTLPQRSAPELRSALRALMRADLAGP